MDALAAALGVSRIPVSAEVDEDEEMEDASPAVQATRTKRSRPTGDDVDEDDEGDDDDDVVRHQCGYWDTLDPVQEDVVESRNHLLSTVIHAMQGTALLQEQDGSASSATRDVREKTKRKRAASSSHCSVSLGTGDKFPAGFEDRAVDQTIHIDDLDTLRRQFNLYDVVPSESGAAASSSSSVHLDNAKTNPHAEPWLEDQFSELMEHLAVATPRRGVMHADAMGREQVVRDLQAHRRALPVFDCFYEEIMLTQAGNVPNPLLVDPRCLRRADVDAFSVIPPRVVRWDPCCNGAKCVFHECVNVYGKTEPFELRCVLFRDEFKMLCEMGQVQITEHRPCVLCCRARPQRFVLAVRHQEGNVSVDMSTNHQVYQNRVNAKGGYAQDFVLRPDSTYAGFSSPIAVFRQSLLAVSRHPVTHLWRVDQSAMYYKEPTLSVPRPGETMSAASERTRTLASAWWVDQCHRVDGRFVLLSRKPRDQQTLYERRLLHDWKLGGYKAVAVVCDLTHYNTVEHVHGSQIWDAHRPSNKDSLGHIITKVLPQSCRTRSASTVLSKYTRIASIQADVRMAEARVRAIVQFLQGDSRYATSSGKPSRDDDELAAKLDRRSSNLSACRVVSRWIVCSLLCNYSFSQCTETASTRERVEIMSWVRSPAKMALAFLSGGMHHIYIWAVRDYLCYAIHDDPVLYTHLKVVFDVDAFMAITQEAWTALRPIVVRAVRACLVDPAAGAVYDRLAGMVGEEIGVKNVPFHRKILDIKYQRPLPSFDKMMASYDPVKNEWCSEADVVVEDMIDDSDEDADDDGIIVGSRPADDDPKRQYIDLTPEKLDDLTPYTIPFYHADLDHHTLCNQGTFCERLCTLFRKYRWDTDPRETPEQQRQVLRPIPRRMAWTMFYWLRCYPSWFGPAEVAQHIIPGLFYFGVPRSVIVDILVICRKRDVGRIGRGKFGIEMHELINAHPYAVRVLRAMCKMWREHQRFSSSSLSADMTRRQMHALRDRFRIPVDAVIPENQMCLYFCACCKTIYSSVPLAHKDMRAITNQSSGWNDVVVDFFTGKFYCRRVRKIECQIQPLYAVPLIGRVYCVNKNYFTLCPQPACGRVMHINSGDPYYTEHGMACALCTRNTRSRHYHRMYREQLDLSNDGKVCCYQCTKHIKRMNAAFILPHGIILCDDHFYPNIIPFLAEKQVTDRASVKFALREFYALVKEQNEQRNHKRNQAALARSRRQTRGFGTRG